MNLIAENFQVLKIDKMGLDFGMNLAFNLITKSYLRLVDEAGIQNLGSGS